MFLELVVPIRAPGAHGHGGVDRGQDRPGIDRRPPPRGGPHFLEALEPAVFEPVPMAVQGAGDLDQVVVGQSDGEPPHQGGLGVPVGQEGVGEALEARIEVGALCGLVEHLEPGRDACGHAVLHEDALRERVQRADGRLVDLVAGRRQTRLGGMLGRHLVDLVPDALAQLGRGRLGERDRRDLAQRGAPASHQLDDPAHQCGRLPGTGPRHHDQSGVELAADGGPGPGVVVEGGHPPTSNSPPNRSTTAPSRSSGTSAFMSANTGASSGAPRFRAHCRSRVTGHRMSKSHDRHASNCRSPSSRWGRPERRPPPPRRR